MYSYTIPDETPLSSLSLSLSQNIDTIFEEIFVISLNETMISTNPVLSHVLMKLVYIKIHFHFISFSFHSLWVIVLARFEKHHTRSGMVSSATMKLIACQLINTVVCSSASYWNNFRGVQRIYSRSEFVMNDTKNNSDFSFAFAVGMFISLYS